ncbi:MAG: hypothetical protein ACAI35_26905 [Candidatus Methylacidiphilales bacterium]|nr:hypothetical protein [Candidatus Methylacidiphilales bacterium]
MLSPNPSSRTRRSSAAGTPAAPASAPQRDELTLCPDEMELVSKGMTLIAKRRLDICSEMELLLTLGEKIFIITGCVVCCKPAPDRPGCYIITVFFLNAPPALTKELGKSGSWKADGGESDWAVRRAWIPGAV